MNFDNKNDPRGPAGRISLIGAMIDRLLEQKVAIEKEVEVLKETARLLCEIDH